MEFSHNDVDEEEDDDGDDDDHDDDNDDDDDDECLCNHVNSLSVGRRFGQKVREEAEEQPAKDGTKEISFEYSTEIFWKKRILLLLKVFNYFWHICS